VLLTLVIGGIVGWLASILMKTDGRMGLLASIVVGAVGSVLGGVISNALGLGRTAPLGSVFVAMGGAAALIAGFLVLGVFDRRAPAR
jgi:uncharacterized membrane protein YeaQ/YmgE (transglycosylase-associated protein family)